MTASRLAMHAELVAMLELDDTLADWAIPNPADLHKETPMASRNNGLPICRHITLGQQLLAIRNQLLDASVDLGSAYPKAAKAVTSASTALKAVDQLRAELDNISAQENRGDGRWAPNIYYGNNRETWEQTVPPILARHQADNPGCECNSADDR